MSVLRRPWGMGRRRSSSRGRLARVCRAREREAGERERGHVFEPTANLDCGGFHTTRARKRGGTPLGASDIYIAPPPLEAWGAVIA